MRKSVIGVSLSVLLTTFSPAFAFGLRCDTGEGLQVYLIEQMIHTEQGDHSTPATLIITSDQEGTMLVRHGREITKERYKGVSQYVAAANDKLLADTVILRLHASEAQQALETDRGAGTKGQLFLVTEDERSVRDLVCYRMH